MGQERVYDVPAAGTFNEVIVSTNRHGVTTRVLPFPSFYPRDPSATAVYLVDADLGIYAFAHPGVGWTEFQAAYGDLVAQATAHKEESLLESSLMGSGPLGPSYPSYGPDDLWIEMLSVDAASQLASMLLHGTIPSENYQLEYKTNLNQPDWVPSQITEGLDGTNVAPFEPEPMRDNAQMFFRAHHSDIEVLVGAYSDAVETNSLTSDPGQPGAFFFQVFGLTNDLTIFYRLSGLASNGVDYTNMPGSVTISAASGLGYVYIQPIEHLDLDFDETVTLSVALSDAYLVDPRYASATIVIHDNLGTNIFQPIATITNGSSIDYHPPTQSLIVGIDYPAGGNTNNFLRIDTNGTVSGWSSITNLHADLKCVVVKQSAAGFASGETYFQATDSFLPASQDVLGKISSNGLAWSTNWAVLTNSLTGTRAFCMDQTGRFGSNLIVVTGILDGPGAFVWRVDSTGQATNLAFLPGARCEAVTVLTNDVAHLGSWAGKILVCPEWSFAHNLFYTVDTNGTIASFDIPIFGSDLSESGNTLGISAEHLDVIQPNQDLYVVLGDSNPVLKLSHTLLTNYVGDLLVTQGGHLSGEPEFYILHWDGSQFMVRGIPLRFYGKNTYTLSEIEGACFAPVNIPPLP